MDSGDFIKLGVDTAAEVLVDSGYDGGGIPIKTLCDLVHKWKVSVGNEFVVQGYQKGDSINLLSSTEVVYDVFENYWADTIRIRIGIINQTESLSILRRRYFAEGFRSLLPEILPRKLSENNHQLFEEAIKH